MWLSWLIQLRRAVTHRLTAPMVASISAAVISFPSENRIICREAADSGFIALTTCEGSSESARQAEPEEAQMPA